jgi:hypothetical protein
MHAIFRFFFVCNLVHEKKNLSMACIDYQVIIIIIIIIIISFLPGTSPLEPTVIPKAEASIFILQYYLYYV